MLQLQLPDMRQVVLVSL